jgi:hypothetical protein
VHGSKEEIKRRAVTLYINTYEHLLVTVACRVLDSALSGNLDTEYGNSAVSLPSEKLIREIERLHRNR